MWTVGLFPSTPLFIWLLLTWQRTGVFSNTPGPFIVLNLNFLLKHSVLCLLSLCILK